MKKYHIEFLDPLKHELIVFIEAENRKELKEKLTTRLLEEYYDIISFRLHYKMDMLYRTYNIKKNDTMVDKYLKVWKTDKPNYKTISVFVRNFNQYK